MAQLIPHSLGRNYHRKTMFEPSLYLSVVPVPVHTVPLKNQRFIMGVKPFTAAARGQEIQMEEKRDGKKERREEVREEERKKDNTSIIQNLPSERSRNPGIAVNLPVIRRVYIRFSSGSSWLYPVSDGSIMICYKGKIFIHCITEVDLGTHQTSPSWRPSVAGCSSQFTAQTTMEDRRKKHQDQLPPMCAVAMHGRVQPGHTTFGGAGDSSEHRVTLNTQFLPG